MNTKTRVGLVGAFVACVLVFALLMAFRDESQNIWIRAAIAGSAFVVLGMSILAISLRTHPNLSDRPK